MTTDNGTALIQRAEEVTRIAPALSTDDATFKTAQRMALALAQSTIVPDAYRNNPANVIVAMEYANRLGCSVLAVMQNLDVIHGRPSLRSTFLIGTVNATGRFTPLRWRWQGTEGADDWGCRTVATDRESGEECPGPLITIALAKAEGWYAKSGSKWKTIPELMLMYRSGAWWTRLYAPEFSLGLHASDEVEDMGPATAERVQSVARALDAGDPPPTPEPEILPATLDDYRKAYHSKWGELRWENETTEQLEARRKDWQEENMGGRSSKGFGKSEYRKALDMLTEGIGLA